MSSMINEIKKHTTELIEVGRNIANQLKNLEERQQELSKDVELAKSDYERIKLSGSSDEIKQAEARLKVAEKSLAAGQRALDNAHKEENRNIADKNNYIKEIDKYSQLERVNAKKASSLKNKAFADNAKTMSDSFTEKVNEAENSKNDLLLSMGLSTVRNMLDSIENIQSENEQLLVTINRFSEESFFIDKRVNEIDTVLAQYRKELIELGIEDDFYLELCLSQECARICEQLSSNAITNGEILNKIERVNIRELADRINKEKERRSNITPLFDDQKRKEFRQKVLMGEYTEKDVIEVGHSIIEDYNCMMNPFFEANDAIERNMQLITASLRGCDDEYSTKKLLTYLKLQAAVYSKLNNSFNSEAIMREVVANQRSVGSDEKQKIFDIQKSDVNAIREINNVRDHLPSSWCDRLNRVGITTFTTSRGFFRSLSDHVEIALSYNPEQKSSRCAYHELGHNLAERYTEIAMLETQFYNRRTEGYELKPMPGYSRSEQARKDHFTELYMGKEYPDGNHEIVSMGMEAMYCGTNELHKDPEYQEFILGLLTAI